MEEKLKNKYFILRHGETIHQINKPNIIYFWPEDKPPAHLTNAGQNQIKSIAQSLKDKKIDLIFSSDILRTKQTAQIIAKELDLKVKIDKRLRDVNWGIFQGKSHKEAWDYYKQNREEKFKKAPPQGESWLDVQKRMIDFVKELEEKYDEKTILIVGHGDPFWLLDSWVKGLTNKEALKSRRGDCPIKTGELKELN